VMMCCMYFARQLPRLMKNKAEKNYDRFCMEGLRGSTMGILGFGEIGRATAQLAIAFGMRVLALNTSGGSYPGVEVLSGKEGKDTVITEADYLVMILPATAATTNFIGRTELQQLKPTAVLINIGRGQTLDEGALINALEEDILRGAALDVFRQEPLPKDSPLWKVPESRLLLSPHNADHTERDLDGAAESFLECFGRFVKDSSLPDRKVDIARGY
jgi:phosphoglycerate dehydrogenase-like enzyme